MEKSWNDNFYLLHYHTLKLFSFDMNLNQLDKSITQPHNTGFHLTYDGHNIFYLFFIVYSEYHFCMCWRSGEFYLMNTVKC